MSALHEGRSHPSVDLSGWAFIQSRGFAESEQRPALTPREVEVLTLVCEGMTHEAIAYHLGISRHTVNRHIGSIHAKLDVGTTIEAACWLVRRERLD